MLNEKRISEAEVNVKAYLVEGLLKNINQIDANIFNTFRKNSTESLKVADHLFRNNLSYLWAVVCSYYSMYYIANAVLYKLGYKVGEKISHKVTADALIVFVRKKLKVGLVESFEDTKNQALDLAGIKADELIQSFDYERSKRSRFQYEMAEEIKIGKAETSLKRAKDFVFEVEKLLV
ncbi:MAG: HEPN domain-containing protein [Candidatus Aenigmarchaeota archaeon]|nr:HEPN domain-containing protein [Candidatus Aenigmarchaeota archaeon]